MGYSNMGLIAFCSVDNTLAYSWRVRICEFLLVYTGVPFTQTCIISRIAIHRSTNCIHSKCTRSASLRASTTSIQLLRYQESELLQLAAKALLARLPQTTNTLLIHTATHTCDPSHVASRRVFCNIYLVIRYASSKRASKRASNSQILFGKKTLQLPRNISNRNVKL